MHDAVIGLLLGWIIGVGLVITGLILCWIVAVKKWP